MLQVKTCTLIFLQIPWEGKRGGICQLQGITPSVVQAPWMYVPGLSVLGQKLADCSELHPVCVLHQRSAPVVSAWGISPFKGRQA